MSQAVNVRRSLSTSGSDATVTWDSGDSISVNWSNGSVDVWSISRDQPAVEYFDDGTALRIGSLRLWLPDHTSIQMVESWLGIPDTASDAADVEPVGQNAAVSEVDIRRFAGLLASGALTLEEFCKLSGLRQELGNDEFDDEIELVDDSLASATGMLGEYQEVFLRTWPEARDEVVTRYHQDGSVYQETAVPQAFDPSYVRRQLDSDYSTYMHATTTARGLFGAYAAVAPELMPTPRIKRLDGWAGFVPVLQNMYAGAQFDAADQKFMKKLEKEVSRGQVSREIEIVRERTKSWFQRKQTPMRSFAERVGWTDLNFIK